MPRPRGTAFSRCVPTVCVIQIIDIQRKNSICRWMLTCLSTSQNCPIYICSVYLFIYFREEKQLILNVYCYLLRNDSMDPFEARRKASKMLGVSSKAISKLIMERTETGTLQRQPRLCLRKNTFEKLNPDLRKTIRRLVSLEDEAVSQIK